MNKVNSYERLRSIALEDQRTHNLVEGAFFSIIKGGNPAPRVLAIMADQLCSMHGLSAEVHPSAVVFYHVSSRAKQPACLVVSLNAGQHASPSAMAVRHGAYSLMQAFEGDADDTDVAADRPQPTHWLETKGRVLLH